MRNVCMLRHAASAPPLSYLPFPFPIGVTQHHLYPVDYSPIFFSAVRLSMLRPLVAPAPACPRCRGTLRGLTLDHTLG